MKPLNDRLYIEFEELVASIAAVEQKNHEKVRNYLKKSNSEGNRLLPFIKDPACRTRVLYDWKDMGPKYQAIVQKHFGDPCEYVAKEPILKLLEKDYEAEEFYRSRLQELKVDHKKLSFYVQRYTLGASWRNLLLKATQEKSLVKKVLGLSMDSFWKILTSEYDYEVYICPETGQQKKRMYCKKKGLLELQDVDIPYSVRNLLVALKEYKEQSYECLIDWRFGNKLAAKAKVDGKYNEDLHKKQEAIIRAAASKHQNFDAAQITRIVNLVFEKQGWPQLSSGTVANIKKKYAHLTTAGARGKRLYDSTLAMQVKRKVSEFPLLFCTLDGWTVELLYQDESGYNNRLVMVVVLDACKKYPIGFAIGDRENADLIRQANRNAILHLRELFGATYRPLQLQSDHYAIKQLTPFYEAMTKLHTPAAVGNAKAKIIEPYFNYLNTSYFQAFPNWSGHNVNALKKNQPNAEYLNQIKTTFPTKEGAIRQIEMVMHQERLVKLAEYRKLWDASPDSNKMVMSKMDWLAVFGTPHTHQNSITGQGIIATLNGEERTYDSFDPLFRSLQHVKWQLYYDATDLHEVLAISEDGKQRFVLQEKRAIPMDIHSMKPEDYAWLKQIRDFNKARKEEIIQTYVSDGATVQEVLNNTPLALNDFNEARVKLMFTTNGQQKEGVQDAKGLKQAKAKRAKKQVAEAKQESAEWNAVQMQYLQSKTDFNQYLD